ncbi:MAG: sugar ABC transporter substrate-binding protein, partial [Rhodospirillaceae bacterium]
VENVFPEIPDDIDQQRALIRAATRSRPDALLVAVAHPSALDDALLEAQAANIPLVFPVSGSYAVTPVTMVSSDNVALARAVAERLFADMADGGDVVILDGNPNSPNSAPRTEGFLAAVAEHPDIRVVDRRDGRYMYDDGLREMRAALDAHPEVDGVLAANDFMALGALDALAERGRTAPVVGVNAMPDAIAAIKAGRLLATSSFDAMKMASVAAEAAYRTLEGETVPARIELPVDVVDAANCDSWD